MRPDETQIVIRHELRAGSSSDPQGDTQRCFRDPQLQTSVHLGKGP